jgi:two-component system, NtrC family, response regulator HydG
MKHLYVSLWYILKYIYLYCPNLNIFLVSFQFLIFNRQLNTKGKILLVDDDKDVLFTARTLLKNEFAEIVTIDSPGKLPEMIRNEDFDIIVLDMNFGPGKVTGEEGLKYLKRIISLKPDSYVIMSTAYGDIELAVESMKAGAIDFIVKPWQKERLLATLRNVADLRNARKEADLLRSGQKIMYEDLDRNFTEIISRSGIMQDILGTVRKVAATDASVLILGENGTGKELIARLIHRLSQRSHRDFVSIDLGAITSSLFESELFGHERGAFTDAKDQRIGRFEIASGGTIFLDEIGNLTRDLQSKLLSVIQKKQITRVGSNKEIPIDFRLICATNSPIFELSSRNEFREDLLYRINTVSINLPPLRERKEDISLLADHFLKIYQKKYNKKSSRISKETLSSLKQYSWPGNIREFQHSIERAVILSDGSTLRPSDFNLLLTRSTSIDSTIVSSFREVEKETIRKALNTFNGNISKAANELGFGRSTLYRKMKKYGLHQI